MKIDKKLLFNEKSNSSNNRVRFNFAKVITILLIFIVLRILLGGWLDNKIEISIINYSSKYTASINTGLSPINSYTYNQDSDTFSSLSSNNFTEDSLYLGSNKLITLDSRVLAMRKFLIDYNSPMYPYSNVFIEEADRTGLDWRMVAAISGVESAFGNLIPYKSNNGWGWKGGPGGSFSVFSSWGQGIRVVTEGLAYGYGTDLTPYDIEATYCPPCGQNPEHAWANGVNRYMVELNYYHDNLDNL